MKLVRKYERGLRRSGSSLSQHPAITYEDNLNPNDGKVVVPLQGEQSSKMSSNMESELKLESLVEVLTMQLRSGRVETKLAVLRWIYHLFNISRPKVSATYLLSICFHDMLILNRSLLYVNRETDNLHINLHIYGI